jgi:hypothetical protein
MLLQAGANSVMLLLQRRISQHFCRSAATTEEALEVRRNWDLP